MSEKRRRFEALALPHLDAAYNLARWLARPPVEADDIVQDAMLRAFRAFDSLRGEDVKPWLLTIVRNSFLSAVDKRKRQHEVPMPEDDAAAPLHPGLVSDQPNAEANLMMDESERNMQTLLASLAPDYRDVLILRELEDMSYGEIARVLDIPIGTVMSRLARARAALKDIWPHSVEGGRHGLQ